MKVNVLMPVYNGEKYLREAIESILNQTYRDFTFIIIDDGSSDQTVPIIESYSDERIKLYKNYENIKLIASLNKGLDLCEAEYIVRMDADDISLPTRIEEQVKFMDANPKVVCSGTWLTDFDDSYSKQVKYEISDALIRINLLYQNQISHPTSILRNSTIKENDLKFDFNYPHCEDYEFWTRLGFYGNLANVSKILIKKRIHADTASNQFACIQEKSCLRVKYNEFKKIGVTAREEDINLYSLMAYANFELNINEIKELGNFLVLLINANKKSLYFDNLKFSTYIVQKWFHLINSSKISWKEKNGIIKMFPILNQNFSVISKVKMYLKGIKYLIK